MNQKYTGKRAFKKIPLELQSKVIAVTGSLPGVGKSYTLQQWEKQLKDQGYQVIVTGSTNKASHKHKTIYSVADWADIAACKREKKFVLKEGKVYTQRSAIIMVDEAWMLDQDQIDRIKTQFPKCLIILFGDPCQFTPIESKEMVKYFRDEYTKDQYNPFTSQILQLIDKGLARNPIRDVDYAFNLKVQHRVKTPELESFLTNVKSGWEAPVKALEFLGKHIWNGETVDFAICRTWEGKHGVYSYGHYRIEGKKRKFLSLKEFVKGVYVGQGNYPKLGIYKNSLFNTKGESIEDDGSISSFDEVTLQGAVTCHSIQGTTLHVGTKVLIDLDDAMSIVPEWKEEHRKIYEDFARFVYIASSRVQSEDDLFFKCENKDRLLSILSIGIGVNEGRALSLKLDEKYIDSSSLSNLNILSFLLSLGFKSRKETKVSKLKYFLSIMERYDIIDIYNSISFHNLHNREKAALLHIGLDTMYKYKEDFEAAERYYFEHCKKEEQELNMHDTTGRSIGEIYGEMEEEEKERTKDIGCDIPNVPNPTFDISGYIKEDVKGKRFVLKCVDKSDNVYFKSYWIYGEDGLFNEKECERLHQDTSQMLMGIGRDWENDKLWLNMQKRVAAATRGKASLVFNSTCKLTTEGNRFFDVYAWEN